MTQSIKNALNLASANRERSIRVLRELVRIPSLTGEEGEAQKYLGMLLGDNGATVTMEEPDVEAIFERFPNVAQYPTHWQHDLVLPYAELPTYEGLQSSGLEKVLNYAGRPNMVGVFKGKGGGRSLILNGHIDTVTIEPTDEWIREPFGAEIEDGRMYGRGTSDMKGGLLAGIMAMLYLREAGAEIRGDVTVESVVNEEHAGNGTLDLIRCGFTADGAIVLEPTNNKVAVSHPGGLYWQVTVPGRPRSPGARWNGRELDGVSAIEKLPTLITALLELEKKFNATATDDPMEKGRAAFSLVIGRVTGGHYETVTASETVLRGGAYFSPVIGEIGEVMAAMTQSIDEANAADDFLRDNPARLEFLHHDDSTRQSPQIPLAVALSNALKERGENGDVIPGPFACDCRHLVNQGGIPSVIFGPGTIAQAHKPDEYIEIEEYLACIEHLIAFIGSWCNENSERPFEAAAKEALPG
jgi:acetylornithine deacetylase